MATTTLDKTQAQAIERRRARPRIRWGEVLGKLLTTLFATFLLFLFLVPLVYMISTSLKTMDQMTEPGAPWYPAMPSSYTAAGGKTYERMSGDERAADYRARLTISRELGHNRVEITDAYLGRRFAKREPGV